MNSLNNDPPSPGRNDKQGTSVDDSSLTPDPSTDYSSKTDASGHQGCKTTGGSFLNLRVLQCAQIATSYDYDMLFEKFKSFGSIQRIKMVFAKNRTYYDAYVTFNDNVEASSALQFLTEEDPEFGKKRKLISITNLVDDPFDYVPPQIIPKEEREERILPLPTWHVASYKEGRENLIRGAEAIQKKVGNIPRGNLKKYGRSLLIKAGNPTQAALLSNYKPSPEGNIKSISPHKSFNTFRGIVYSRDLFDYEEWEILELCPPSVYRVQKLKGDNNAILLTFTSNFIPDTIFIDHSRIKVKKYYSRPTQCFKCYEYGHGHDKCKNTRKCSHCSGEHEPVENCANASHCFLCEGDHSPKSRNCTRYKFEQEVLDVANNQFISIGSAKQIVMGANKSPDSTYAKVIKALKIKSFRAPQRETPATKATETGLPIPPSHPEGAKPRSRKRNEPQEHPSKGTTDTANQAPEKENSSTTKYAPKMENVSKKTSRDDRDTSEGFTRPKRMKSYKSSDDESDKIEISNPFAALDSLEGQAVTKKIRECTPKPQRTRSVENIPCTVQQTEALSVKENRASPHNTQRRSSFSKLSIPPTSRVKKLEFNNFQQGESHQKAHAAGKQ